MSDKTNCGYEHKEIKFASSIDMADLAMINDGKAKAHKGYVPVKVEIKLDNGDLLKVNGNAFLYPNPAEKEKLKAINKAKSALDGISKEDIQAIVAGLK